MQAIIFNPHLPVTRKTYKASDRMCDVISDEFHLLQTMCRFGIALGCGERTVEEVCEAAGVDTATFLAVANYIHTDGNAAAMNLEDVSVQCLTDYLERAHNYFLSFQLPAIRRKLLEAINCAENRDVAFLILKFFDEYIGDVRRHMQYENKHVFTYVRSLLGGTRPQGFEIARFEKSHLGVDKKLQELKNIIIKYYTSPTTPEHLNMVLFDIFECEADLRTHCRLEDDLFVPAVKILELSTEQAADKDSASNAETNPENRLSERECDIVRCVVRGMANKEIAAQLFISLNTVLTHRKNISRKLNIHSVAGLTIYAIAAGLVSLEEVGIK